ncbi:MAG: hypothetical protein LLF94_07940 [Chlamydiales bacterium]|nr:hypothetical protein [Chlamydiales bacterium]
MYLLLLLLVLTSCSQDSDLRTAQGVYVVRMSDEFALEIPPQTKMQQTPYPWQPQGGSVRSITKEYFRCKGNFANPPLIITKDGKEINRFYDCSGADKHSLPLRDGKEFIYPILLDILNHVQNVTGNSVIVSSGHRCITHQAFMDPSPKGSSSKHQMGAEVDFYVQGLEEQPMKIIEIILNYYKDDPAKEYKTFSRFEKPTDVSTAPWLNKEIFIKLFKRTEGRNHDNRHPYPYISIQVRFDRQKNERVTFSPELAHGLLRK